MDRYKQSLRLLGTTKYWLGQSQKIYEPKNEKISNDDEFIQLLENVLNELHNGHSSLNTNLNSSNRLIPSGSDFYVEKPNNKFYIQDLRKGFGADLSGLKIGMEVKLFNGIPIEVQLKNFFQNTQTIQTKKCINMLLTCCLQELTIKKEKSQSLKMEKKKFTLLLLIETEMNCFTVKC